MDENNFVLRSHLCNCIVYVHSHLSHTSLDEGDIDMYNAMRVYRDVGFTGPFMMDHTPLFAQSQAGWAGRAYAVGYIRGLIQSVYR